MNDAASGASKHRPKTGSRAREPGLETLELIHENVHGLLSKSPVFLRLPPEKQREIRDHTVKVTFCVVEPDGLRLPLDKAGPVAEALLAAVDFPAFVAGLVNDVFQAIVDASAQQMEAYGRTPAGFFLRPTDPVPAIRPRPARPAAPARRLVEMKMP